MRKLVVMFGASGSGKTSWIEENGLTGYSISLNGLREKYNSPKMSPDGSFEIDKSNDGLIWKNLFEILEFRMKNGEFTVVDANNLNIKTLNRYHQLARQYKYELILGDFTKVSATECKIRNEKSLEIKSVSRSEIDEQYERIHKIRNYAHGMFDSMISENFVERLELSSWENLSDYKKVHHIGDIHGCYEALMTYLVGGVTKPDEAYVFVGDYIDRGTQNAEVVEFLMSLRNKTNVFFLTGNHDIRLEKFSRGRTVKNHAQFNETREELNVLLNQDRIGLRDMAMWTSSFREYLFYKYLDKKVYVTHGGLSAIPDFVNGIASKELINGVGGRKFDVDNAFQNAIEASGDTNTIQIHGHRNRFNLPAMFYSNSINLEGKVEFGEFLRVCTLEKDENNEVIIEEHHIQNRNFHPFLKTPELEVYDDDVNRMREEFVNAEVEEAYDYGRNYIAYEIEKENSLPEDLKDMQSVIVDEDNYIVHRSYNRLNDIGEEKKTSLVNLSEKLVFPVVIYNKYDGVGVAKSSVDIGVKSYEVGAQEIEESFFEKLDREQRAFMEEFIEKHNVTLQFEFIKDDLRDNIIRYGKDEYGVILLDAVKNQVKFETLPEMVVHEFVGEFNNLGKMCILFKQLVGTVPTWGAFLKIYRDIKADSGNFRDEGFVFEDAKGFRFGLDTNWYRLLKGIREEMDSPDELQGFDEDWFEDVKVSTLGELFNHYNDLVK